MAPSLKKGFFDEMLAVIVTTARLGHRAIATELLTSTSVLLSSIVMSFKSITK
ncbi:hypothetical protein [Colwellia sp. KU-HH00111]|uniref:hypothetical protein n=1 Tax=Colwellia sp. KU-HH00111 TaxID=3127652 RepID=UPI00336538B9